MLRALVLKGFPVYADASSSTTVYAKVSLMDKSVVYDGKVMAGVSSNLPKWNRGEQNFKIDLDVEVCGDVNISVYAVGSVRKQISVRAVFSFSRLCLGSFFRVVHPFFCLTILYYSIQTF